MARNSADLGAASVGEQGRGSDQARGDDERLGDRRVADGVRVARRAVRDEVDADCVAELLEVILEAGLSEPGVEKTGGLGALTGRYDDSLWCGRGAWRAASRGCLRGREESCGREVIRLWSGAIWYCVPLGPSGEPCLLSVA